MQNTLIKAAIKPAIITLVLTGLMVGNFAFAVFDADKIVEESNGDPQALVCNVLAGLGIGCFKAKATNTSSANNTGTANTTNTTSNANQNSSNGSFSSSFNSSVLKADIFSGKITRKYSSNEVSLIRSSSRPEIYEIIGGKKHVIPNEEIFYDYGYKPEMIRLVNQSEVDRYPRVKLVSVKGDKAVYYLTEGGMLRLIPDAKIYESYGLTKSDIITISKKEFNYYPQNKYIFQETPLNRDVFMIVNGVKKYLTPMAIRRMELKTYMVAPVNQFEMDYYKIGEPVIN